MNIGIALSGQSNGLVENAHGLPLQKVYRQDIDEGKTYPLHIFVSFELHQKTFRQKDYSILPKTTTSKAIGAHKDMRASLRNQANVVDFTHAG